MVVVSSRYKVNVAKLECFLMVMLCISGYNMSHTPHKYFIYGSEIISCASFELTEEAQEAKNKDF